MNRLDLHQPKEVLDYRANELALQDRLIKYLEKTLDNPEAPPSIVYANTMRLQKAKATLLLYNDLMNGYIHTLIQLERQFGKQ